MGGDFYVNGQCEEGNTHSFLLCFRQPMYDDDLNLNYKTVKEIRDICKKYLDDYYSNSNRNTDDEYKVEQIFLLLAFLVKYKDEDVIEYY